MNSAAQIDTMQEQLQRLRKAQRLGGLPDVATRKDRLQRAIDRYKATALPASEDGREQRMRNYGTPIGPGNVGGNPHGVTVPEHILTRRHDELIDAYERRISAVVTHLKYGKRTGGRV